MKYFNSLPLVAVTDTNNNTKIYRNIMTRLSVTPDILNNPVLYYSYDLQQGDTPEIVAQKYYGDSYRYWIVMFSNQYLDPQWDWPLDSYTLDQYITKKYLGLGIDPYSIRSYQKTITTNNLTTGTVTKNVVDVSETDYNSLVESTHSYTFASENVQVVITKSTQSYYEYEVNLNDSKKTIKLLNKEYVQQIESEFLDLVK